MDPTLQAKIDEAKANGYTDEELNAYLGSQTSPPPQQGLGPMDRSEEYTGLAQGMGMNAVGNVLEYGVPAAAAAYGVKKLIDAYKGPVSPAQASQISKVGQAAQNVGQAARATGTGGAGAFNQMANQLSSNTVQFPKGPVSPAQVTTPTTVAPQTQAPGMMRQGLDYANKMRQVAAEKVMQNAGNIAKAGVGLGALTYSAPLGPPVPTKGPYRGMEINPMSGRPWRPEELAQINR
jgi:hypothetical protein